MNINGLNLTVRLQGYTEGQIAFIRDHAAEYGEAGDWSLEDLLADYADEIGALA
jgi:hypothetical protein